jgi:hypothetical protein
VNYSLGSHRAVAVIISLDFEKHSPRIWYAWRPGVICVNPPTIIKHYIAAIKSPMRNLLQATAVQCNFRLGGVVSLLGFRLKIYKWLNSSTCSTPTTAFTDETEYAHVVFRVQDDVMLTVYRSLRVVAIHFICTDFLNSSCRPIPSFTRSISY